MDRRPGEDWRAYWWRRRTAAKPFVAPRNRWEAYKFLAHNRLILWRRHLAGSLAIRDRSGWCRKCRHLRRMITAAPFPVSFHCAACGRRRGAASEAGADA